MKRKRISAPLRAELARLYAEAPRAIARAERPPAYTAAKRMTAREIRNLLADADRVAAILRRIAEIEAQ
jgi:hypothetical protein